MESGDTIHDMIRFVGPARVKMIGTGWVASAGAHIYLGAKKRTASVCRSRASCCTSRSAACAGQASDITIEAEEILKSASASTARSRRKPASPSRGSSRDTERNYWLGAEEAKAYGLVSRIISSASEV